MYDVILRGGHQPRPLHPAPHKRLVAGPRSACVYRFGTSIILTAVPLGFYRRIVSDPLAGSHRVGDRLRRQSEQAPSSAANVTFCYAHLCLWGQVKQQSLSRSGDGTP
jgi:hypothetical protein